MSTTDEGRAVDPVVASFIPTPIPPPAPPRPRPIAAYVRLAANIAYLAFSGFAMVPAVIVAFFGRLAVHGYRDGIRLADQAHDTLLITLQDPFDEHPPDSDCIYPGDSIDFNVDDD